MRNRFRLAGALLQKLDRDTQKCAYKCCFAVINDKPVSCVSVCGCVCKDVLGGSGIDRVVVIGNLNMAILLSAGKRLQAAHH